jgi:hypothetical protein
MNEERYRKRKKYYKGEYLNGVPHGKGTFTYPDGSSYEGDFVDGEENGKGKLIIVSDFTPDGYGLGYVYEGDFQDGGSNGYGIQTYNDGVRYEGEFDDCFPNGKGTITYTDGSSYEGEFNTGLENGKGTLTYPKGDKVEGEFRDGKPVGDGTFITTDGETHTHNSSEFCGECYERHLKEDGISNDGFSINPEYMTDEDVIMEIEVKKEITQIFEVRVHKDHKYQFDVGEYLSSYEVESFWENLSLQEMINQVPEYHRVVDTKKVKHIMSGDYERKDNGRKKDYFFHYVCDDGIFYDNERTLGLLEYRLERTKEEETKSFDDEVVEIPKLLN